MYEEVITELKELRTIAAHITALGKVMNNTEDQNLKTLMGNVITSLQQAHANPKVKGKTTPGNLYNAQDVGIKALIAYCEKFRAAKKPEWQVLAERHGWAPKS
ncbi:hypothetical protein ACSFBI_32535 [Variovorax sp. RB3P1]|uniref:hypothetical protein n=1 Tax=Variovorax sp. RB3P1 TaxID=3443732 RepID=UPI003F46CA12